MDDSQQLTPKAIRTRQHILDVAIGLFATKGYEETTMRDIAAAADCSLGLAYRYYASKEALVMAHYQQLSAEYLEYLDRLEPAPLADLFRQAMTAKIEQVTPYRDSTSALFSSMMNPKSGIAVLGDNTAAIRSDSVQAFADLARRATDAPKELQIDQIALLFYSAHLLVLLFWMYDRTPGCKATHQLLDFAHSTLGLLRPMLMLPPVAKSVARLAAIIEPVFGKSVL